VSLSIYNTLARTVEPFRPIVDGRVDMFVCGPTVYDFSHVGHAKTYTQFDFIARYLRFKGYEVRYVQNITDVDDKIIARAKMDNVDPRELAAEYEDAYKRDMESLHNTSVDIYARAHDYIDQIVSQVQRLIDRGHAYRLDDGWYFDLSTFPEYGKLSRRTQLQAEDAVSRIDDNADKKNAGDFALWKSRKPSEPFWETSIGPGRPGWHIEDTAITESVFGAQYDLHGGAVDLIFPHHEAEIAQLEAASGKAPLARYWMHTGLLRVDGAKMSKSLNNFMTIRQVLERTDYRTLRYAFLSQHYRSQMELTDTALDSAKSARERVETFARSADRYRDDPLGAERAGEVRASFFERLDNDFDTPGALAVLFSYIKEVNRSNGRGGSATWDFLVDVESLFDAFRLGDQNPSKEIEEQISARAQLRKEGKYTEADAIREHLQKQGVMLKDTANGTEWWYDR
jgi:cysteinyl-tRNA synthetase